MGDSARREAPHACGSTVAARPQGKRPQYEASGRGACFRTARAVAAILPLIRLAHFVHSEGLILMCVLILLYWLLRFGS